MRRRGPIDREAGIVLGMCLTSVPVRADGPEVGFNAGVAVPIKEVTATRWRESVGTVGFDGGYRFNLTDNIAAVSACESTVQLLWYRRRVLPNPAAKGATRTNIGSIFSITGGSQAFVRGQRLRGPTGRGSGAVTIAT